MLLKPQPLENIIVGVKRNNHFNWYVTKKDLWFMSLIKLREMYADKFKESGIPLSNISFEEEIERQDIPLLNETTIPLFEPRIKKFIARASELNEILKHEISLGDREKVFYTFLPSLYIDFDSKSFYSMYTEPISFEDYVPQGWRGMYDDFLDLIDCKDMYWRDKDEIIFDFRKGDGKNER